MAVEENTEFNLEYMPLTAVLGAYDVDSADRLTLMVDNPERGVLTMSTEQRSIPSNAENCNSDSDTSESGEKLNLPCGLLLPHNKVM